MLSNVKHVLIIKQIEVDIYMQLVLFTLKLSNDNTVEEALVETAMEPVSECTSVDAVKLSYRETSLGN